MVQSFLGRVGKVLSGQSKRGRRRSYSRQRLGFETLEDKRLLTIVPTGFTETLVASALSSPTSLVTAHDGRVFIAQQNGTIRIVKNDGLSAVPFATLTADSTGERGLLGITLDPNFDSNHYLYVFYTATAPTHMRISRLTANGDTLLAGSEQVLMEFPSIAPDAIWRMGGALNFGPDGKLYIGVGDEQNSSFAQSLDNPFGKILRINRDGTIPTDNPFYNTTTGNNRAIWAYGLRNPYTATFQAGTGRFFINDVGQSSREEINEGAAGRNFGWPSTEGTFTQSQHPNFTEPLYAYSHNDGTAITGGAFYNPNVAQFPTPYAGQYFFNDFGAGEIRIFNPATGAVTIFARDLSFPTNLSISDDGSLYYLSRGIGTGGPGTGTGQLFKVRYASNTAPSITKSPTDMLVSVGQGASFSVAVTGTSPFTYQWQRNGFDISGATAAIYSLPSTSVSDNGARFRVVVTNSFGSATSAAATLAVTTQLPPTAQISSPAPGTTYAGGQGFHFVGKGTDAAGGTISASRFVWQVDYYLDGEVHQFIPPTSDLSTLDFTVDTRNETSLDAWYRVSLTVTDSIGLSSTTQFNLLPTLSHISVNTNVPGLSLFLDGQLQSSPFSVTGIVGLLHTLSAPLTQTVGGVTYLFQSWSNGSAANNNINFPSSDTTYTARYAPVNVNYLSDMSMFGTVVNGFGPVERDKSNGEKKANDGHPIQLNGVTYLKGLGAHSASTILYNLDPGAGYKAFISDIGVDDEVGSKGSVVFQVWGDNVLLFQSSKMTGDSSTQTVNVNVEGVRQLKLVVTDGGDGNSSDHADWANARLFAGPSAQQLVSIVTPPANKLVAVGRGATFSVAATGSGPLSYQWQRNGVNIQGATSATYSLPTTTVADSGAKFRVVVTNIYDSQTSAAATLTVTTQSPPTAQIVSPANGTTYVGGQLFHFVGTGTDGTGVTLAGSQFVWQVDFHHGSQAQSFIAPTSGSKTLDFTIPTNGETAGDVWYRAYLTVTDSIGLSSTTSFDLAPVVKHITVNANVPGLSLSLDGQAQNGLINADGVVGIQRTLSAPQIQVVGSVTYIFKSWSDGGAATHTIAFPSSNTTYTATYTAASVSYLSDMPTFGKVASGYGPLELDKSNGEKKANDGRPIQLNGVTYLKGLGTSSASAIVYDLDLGAQYKTFNSDIGIDDEVGSKGGVVFQVWGDNVLLFQSSKMTGDSPTQTINVDIEGVQQLRLVVTDGGDGKSNDHADWANARLLAPPGAGQQVDFYAAPVSYLTGTNAHGVFATDLNGDGKPDLASANAASNTVSVLLGRGDGTFVNAGNYAVGKDPKAVAAADLNGDGRIDLVVANQESNAVSVLMNLGNGLFGPAVNYAATAKAHDVALADLDGDGDFDIVSVGWGAKLARVLFNNGDGTFGGATNYAVANAPHSVTAADFNGDGRPDVAVADHGSNNVAVLINNGNGTFKKSVYYTVGSKPHMVRSGDLNGDGFVDLATANEGSNTVSVLLGTGTGTFASAASYATGPVPKGIAIGDVNGDGRLDLVVANTAGNYPKGNYPGGNTISVLLNAVRGKFAKPLTFVTGTTPFDLALADFDGNGKLDVATSNWTTADVTVLLKV